MMRVVGRLGRAGSIAFNAQPQTGTIVPAEDLPRVIEETRLGRIEYRADKTSNIHVPVGKALRRTSCSKIWARLWRRSWRTKLAALKGIYVHKAVLTSTMGPGIPLDTNAKLAMKADSY
ncbi:MAG: hypothetical protein R2911_02020 [Caldilineaceae bacterium]